MPSTRTILVCGIAALVATAAQTASAAQASAPLWGRWEGSFEAQAFADPGTELELELTPPSGKARKGVGFWDGGTTWRARVMPDEPGTWRYRTRSRPVVAGLDAQEGSFVCRPGEPATSVMRHGAIRVASGQYHLEHADSRPFFWLGDTVWNGPLLSEADDWAHFLKDRAEKRFTVIQFNAIAPWRTAPTDGEGQVALVAEKGRLEINPRYFRRLDQRMNAINDQGLVAAPVLLWANQREDLGNTLSEEDAIRLIRYQVARYGAHHVAWILAGDNSYKGKSSERWKRIGRAVFGESPHAPVTTHPTGMNWPWESWREERWLDFLGDQSGHGDDAGTLRWIHSGPPHEHWRTEPHRPVINLEPPYEDHRAYQSRQPHSAYNVRRAVYWSLLSTPTAGVTYGAHGIWSWQTETGKEPRGHAGTGIARPWREAMALPGSEQMKHVAELFTALPWTRLRPDQELLTRQPGGDDPAHFVGSARTEEGDLAILYLPVGGEVSLQSQRLANTISAQWIDPRTGKRVPARSESDFRYRAPDNQDWILLLQKSTKP
ncbi:DUF4038 domain-containing protein [Singulisphaera sp. Ch08]|uniref:DUF4038 domain-containing protein n=1 Tax=Singulisphaera sp. Ch08 TaxID=3120278 RepID=A0AAU7C7B0_9BACT